MMELPEVLSVQCQAEQARISLGIDAGLSAFQGHFDESPVVPGVVQLQWALAFCERYLQEVPPDTIDEIEALKFQQVIQPGMVVELLLELKAGKLAFAISSASGRHSSGRVVLR